MAINYTTESLEGIPEALHEHYTKGESGYTLNVAGVVPESKYQEASQKAVDNATEASRRRKTVERITGKLGLENADGLDEVLDSLIAGKGKASPDQQAIIDQMKAASTKEREGLMSQITALKMGGAKEALKSAILSANFHPEIADDITQTAMSRVSLDEEGNLRIMGTNGSPLAGSGADGFATFADLAKELAAAKPSFLVDKGKGGGGKLPASGGSGGSGGDNWSTAKTAKEKAAILKSKLNK